LWRPTVAACCASPTLTGNRGDAEDLLQDALADAYRNWSKVAASHALYAHVRRILVNRHTSRMRKRSVSERPVEPTAIPAAAEPDHSARIASNIALLQRLYTLSRLFELNRAGGFGVVTRVGP